MLKVIFPQICGLIQRYVFYKPTAINYFSLIQQITDKNWLNGTLIYSWPLFYFSYFTSFTD